MLNPITNFNHKLQSLTAYSAVGSVGRTAQSCSDIGSNPDLSVQKTVPLVG